MARTGIHNVISQSLKLLLCQNNLFVENFWQFLKLQGKYPLTQWQMPSNQELQSQNSIVISTGQVSG